MLQMLSRLGHRRRTCPHSLGRKRPSKRGRSPNTLTKELDDWTSEFKKKVSAHEATSEEHKKQLIQANQHNDELQANLSVAAEHFEDLQRRFETLNTARKSPRRGDKLMLAWGYEHLSSCRRPKKVGTMLRILMPDDLPNAGIFIKVKTSNEWLDQYMPFYKKPDLCCEDDNMIDVYMVHCLTALAAKVVLPSTFEDVFEHLPDTPCGTMLRAFVSFKATEARGMAMVNQVSQRGCNIAAARYP
ncbi:hypothetical protein K461DRAFT_267355 [Myriangium duriaei CBS 260.36]|uniref:Uncharacterized protein n=1 Tax=Myriangium duriaei CBS 260.36 TaxID=1168546 RepID=A0A9P4MIL1_9PEZI|nr:hypothetical protein K461DRAFT_267355 [Myriangium duriaei CBS 260.36]